MIELKKIKNFHSNCEELQKLENALEEELNKKRKDSSKINFLKNKIVEIKTTPCSACLNIHEINLLYELNFLDEIKSMNNKVIEKWNSER